MVLSCPGPNWDYQSAQTESAGLLQVEAEVCSITIVSRPETLLSTRTSY
jgi:hypothetical protein